MLSRLREVFWLLSDPIDEQVQKDLVDRVVVNLLGELDNLLSTVVYLSEGSLGCCSARRPQIRGLTLVLVVGSLLVRRSAEGVFKSRLRSVLHIFGRGCGYAVVCRLRCYSFGEARVGCWCNRRIRREQIGGGKVEVDEREDATGRGHEAEILRLVTRRGDDEVKLKRKARPRANLEVTQQPHDSVCISNHILSWVTYWRENAIRSKRTPRPSVSRTKSRMKRLKRITDSSRIIDQLDYSI